MTTLEELRRHFQPKIPEALHQLAALLPDDEGGPLPVEPEIAALLPKSAGGPLFKFKKAGQSSFSPMKVGVVLSGGQAPGGHSVIIGLYDALKKLNADARLFGFLEGPAGIIKGSCCELTHDLLAEYRNQGGFDMIGSGRTKIETPEQLAAAEKSVRELDLDGLVIIGGDDSNTNAALLAEYFLEKGVKTAVVGVPKTIDGDLKNALIATSFGFDTATKTFSATIGNLTRDALSAKKYTFFVKLMGRSASHITLECALNTHPNYTLIGEEAAEKKKTVKQIVGEIADVVEARSQKGKNYGLVLIPEGAVEFIPEFKQLISELNELLAKGEGKEIASSLTPASKECFTNLPETIRRQLLMERDPHGNVQVSKIESERMLIRMVKEELKRRQFKGEFSAQPYFCGYEGRSCLPSNFDTQYCYSLGIVAALLIAHKKSGYMSGLRNLAAPVEEWEPCGFPIASMMTLERRHGEEKPVIRKALVDLNGKLFQSFAKERGRWAVEDAYLYPGPIQFFGPPEITEAITRTLQETASEPLPAS